LGKLAQAPEKSVLILSIEIFKKKEYVKKPEKREKGTSESVKL